MKKFLRNKNIRIGGFYVFASVFSSFMTMAAGIVMIKWLTPAEIGMWQSISAFQAYFTILEIGIPNGLNRELPFLMGQQKDDEAVKYVSAAYFYSFLLAGVLLLATLIAVVLLWIFHKPIDFISGITTLGVVVCLISIQRFLTVTFRSLQSFHKLSARYIFNGFAVISLLPLVYYYKYYGLLVYNIGILLINVIQLYWIRPIKIKPQLDFTVLKNLSKTGIPVYIMGYFRGISASFNRLVLLKFGGVIMVGSFAPVAAVISSLNLFPTVFANMFFPRMTHRFGQTGDPKSLWGPVWKTLLILFVINIPIVAMIWGITPYLISTYFPNYNSAIPAMQIAAVALLFSGGLVTHNCFYSIKAYNVAALYSIVEFSMLAVVPYAMVKINEPQMLVQVAKAVVITSFLLFILNFVLLRRTLYNPKYLAVPNA